MNADEIKCPFCAETIKAEASVCRYCKRNLKSLGKTNPIVGIVIAVLIALVAYYLVSPFIAASTFISAVKNHDDDKVISMVNFPMVKESIRSQTSSAWEQQVEGMAKAQSDPLAKLGTAFVGGVAGSLINNFVAVVMNPRDLVTWLDSMDFASRNSPSSGDTSSNQVPKAAPVTTMTYLSLDKFLVSKSNRPISLVFTRKNLFSWELTECRFNNSSPPAN